MSAFEIRPFRADDVRDLEGVFCPIPVEFGRTLLRDGRPVAYGGAFLPFGGEEPWAFFHVSPEARQAVRLPLCRAVRLVLFQTQVRVHGRSLLTYLDHRKPGATRFLRWAGFRKTKRTLEINSMQFEVHECPALNSC